MQRWCRAAFDWPRAVLDLFPHYTRLGTGVQELVKLLVVLRSICKPWLAHSIVYCQRAMVWPVLLALPFSLFPKPPVQVNAVWLRAFGCQSAFQALQSHNCGRSDCTLLFTACCQLLPGIYLHMSMRAEVIHTCLNLHAYAAASESSCQCQP